MAKDMADAVVVGAGIIGAATAFHLARQGVNVIVLDAKTPGEGATGVSAGMLSTYHAEWSISLLSHASWHEFSNWEDMVGGSAGIVGTGCLNLSRSDESTLRERVRQLQEIGVVCELLRGPDLCRLYPQFTWSDETLAVWEPDAAYADTRRCTRRYLERATSLGAEVRVGVSALGLMFSNGSLRGLRSTEGLISTNTVVVASGAWSVTLPLLAGVNHLPRTRLIASMRVAVEGYSGGPACVDDESASVWFRPDGEERVLVGSISNMWDMDPDKPLKIRKETTRDILMRFHALFPESGASLLETRCGLDVFTPDHLPIVDRWGLGNGAYIAFGFNGVGFRVAPAIGKSLADWVVTGQAPSLVRPFTLDRVAEWPKESPFVQESEKPNKLADEDGDVSKQNSAKSREGRDGRAGKEQEFSRRKQKSSVAVLSSSNSGTNGAKSKGAAVTGLTIRQALERDLERLIPMVRAYIDFYRRPQPESAALEALLRYLQMNPCAGRQFLAEVNGGLVGFATLYFTFSTLRGQKAAVFNDLYVSEEFRRGGIAQALFEACRGFVEENGYAYMEWVTQPNNHAARAFYAKMGAQQESWLVYSV